MSRATKVQGVQLDRFFTVAEERLDRWRSLLQAARAWEAAANKPQEEAERDRGIFSSAFAELRQWEDFFAFPAPVLLKKLQERVAAGDAIATVAMAQQTSTAL